MSTRPSEAGPEEGEGDISKSSAAAAALVSGSALAPSSSTQPQRLTWVQYCVTTEERLRAVRTCHCLLPRSQTPFNNSNTSQDITMSAKSVSDSGRNTGAGASVSSQVKTWFFSTQLNDGSQRNNGSSSSAFGSGLGSGSGYAQSGYRNGNGDRRDYRGMNLWMPQSM